jgi:hypothetical protein
MAKLYLYKIDINSKGKKVLFFAEGDEQRNDAMGLRLFYKKYAKYCCVERSY